MKKIYKTGVKDMKQVFDQFRKLNAQEKATLMDEHSRLLKEYADKTRVFIDKLPPSRLEDYRLLRNRNPKGAKNNETIKSQLPK